MFNFIGQVFNTGMPLSSPPTSPARRARQAPDAAARPDRKQAILLAAGKLFAQQGYRGVTIRQIADEASVPLALVSYYYGQKHELFHAIFEHWSHTIDERLAALQVVSRDPQDPQTLHRIIQAFTGPVLKLRATAEGEYYARLVALQLSHAREEADGVLRTYFDPLAHAFIDALHEALPHATRGQAAWCYQFGLGALLYHLSDTRVESLSRGENRPADPAAATLLNTFSAEGIGAARPPPPGAPSPTRGDRP
jgi:AcrR family transcriptional regulator